MESSCHYPGDIALPPHISTEHRWILTFNEQENMKHNTNTLSSSTNPRRLSNGSLSIRPPEWMCLSIEHPLI